MTKITRPLHRLSASMIAVFVALSFWPAISNADDLTFGSPTTNTAVSACFYNSTTCFLAGKHHTGIDYHNGGTNEVFASNTGKIAWLQHMSTGDKGMGNNIIIEHQIGTSKTYTSYSHMASIVSTLSVGSIVTKGQKIGIIGGSGYGNATYWARHLHFEVKDRAVTGNPSGAGSYWGYTPTNSDGFGYHDPNAYIGKVVISIVSTPSVDSLTDSSDEGDSQE